MKDKEIEEGMVKDWISRDFKSDEPLNMEIMFAKVNAQVMEIQNTRYKCLEVNGKDAIIATHEAIEGKIVCVPTITPGMSILAFELPKSYETVKTMYEDVWNIVEVSP